MSDEITLARHLLGKPVKMTVDDACVVEGKLLAFSDDGEVVIQDPSGIPWHCWPMLKIEASDGEVS
jgi:hypothetical protein